MSSISRSISGFNKLSPEVQKALEEYQRSVDHLCEQELNLEFNNKDQYHAAIVMPAIFRSAKKSIKIFCGNFSGEVSNHSNYLDGISTALTNGVSIDVIFEELPRESSKCLSLLKNNVSKGAPVTLGVLEAGYRKRVLQKGSEYLRHFTLGDDRMFRYETESNTFKAICNFDDKDTVTILSTNFAFLKGNSLPLAI